MKIMSRLPHPHHLHLQAAEGWLELGAPDEAVKELEEIPSNLQKEPEVLKVLWGIHAAHKKWEAALEVSGALLQLEPEDASGWVHHSYALHELKRTREARDHL